MRLVLVFFLCFVCLTLQMFSQPARLSAAQAGYLGGDTTCGIIWDEPILLSDTAYDAYSPKIALSGDDTVHVTWESGKPGLQLPYRRSTTAGLNFEPTRNALTDSIKYPYRTSWNHILAQGNRVYIFSAYYATSTEPLLMHISTDYGTTWGRTRSITDTVGIPQSVALNLDTLAIVYHYGYRRILRSTDGGETWSRTNEDLSIWSRVALSENNLHLILLNDTTGQTEYRRSNNLGDTWIQKTFLSTPYYISALDPIIAASSNSQDTRIVTAWRDAKYGCIGYYGCSIISKTGILNKIADSVVWRDEEKLTEEPRGYVPEIAVHDTMRLVAWNKEVIAGSIYHVVSRFSRSMNQPWCAEVDHTENARTAERAAIALSKKVIHIVWHQYVEGSPQPQTLRVFYRRGVFLPTDVKENKETIPNEFSLSQNYPNPFNPTTKIGFQIPDYGLVSIKIYDVFGREVTTLVNERKQPGEYEVEWNPSTSSGQVLASGVYFVRMSAGKYFSTMKAVLMK